MFNKQGVFSGIKLILLISFTSCVNLQHVNKFATSSVITLGKQDDIGYSFAQHCLDFECNKGIYHIPDITRDLERLFPASAILLKWQIKH